ncbi:MAG TPA: hypothetical protein VN969_06520 [Streptosporangiaceae bacterium]|nr:hypothetical protein [Streptosporangiaceae bacterium]
MRSSWDRSCTRDEQLDAVPNSAIQLRLATLQEMLAGIGAAIDAGGRQLHGARLLVTAR